MLQPSWQVLWAEGIQIYMRLLFDPANAPLEICPLQPLTEVHAPQGAWAEVLGKEAPRDGGPVASLPGPLEMGGQSLGTG